MHIAVRTYKKQKGYKIAKRFIFRELLLFSVLCFTTQVVQSRSSISSACVCLYLFYPSDHTHVEEKNSRQPRCNHVEPLCHWALFFFSLFYYQAKTIFLSFTVK
jgi:hypothetical protein